MTEKLFGRGRRGGVLLIAGAVLGAAVAGPGASLAVKAMGVKLTTTTADKRYIKKGETVAASQTAETSLRFNSTSFQPIASTTIKTPGPGFLYVTGSVSAKDDTTTTSAQGSKLDYRLAVGSTALSNTADSFELFLPDLGAPLPANEPRQNGSVSAVAKVSAKGSQTVSLQAQIAGQNAAATVLGRSVSALFVPKGKLPKTGRRPSGGGGGNTQRPSGGPTTP